jgi:thiol-disulfide isomerase/thioredoxin
MEALILSMTADGPAANLPPHIVLAGACDGGTLVIAILETTMRKRLNVLRSLVFASLVALIVMISSAVARAEAAACAAVPDALAKYEASEAAQPDSGVAFLQDGEREVTLSEWRGKGIVMNFWATWCAPCVAEMPALDALRADLAEHGIDVLAVSTDFGGADAVRAFYAGNGIEHLPVLTDARSRMAQSVGVFGLPTTVLFDAEGREVGRVLGPAEWDAPEVAAFLRTCLSAAG